MSHMKTNKDRKKHRPKHQHVTVKIPSSRFDSYISANTLDLRNLGLCSADVPDIVECLHHHPEIKKVDLSNNAIGPDGAILLAKENKSATSLNLRWNKLGDAGVVGIGEWNAFATKLELAGNKVEDAGAIGFAEKNKSAVDVDFGCNNIHASGALALVKGNDQIKLSRLVLESNHVGNEGAKDIAHENKSVMVLDLRDNQINDDGAKNLVANKAILDIQVADNPVTKPVMTQLHIQTNLNKENKRTRENAWMKYASLIAASKSTQGSWLSGSESNVIPEALKYCGVPNVESKTLRQFMHTKFFKNEVENKGNKKKKNSKHRKVRAHNALFSFECKLEPSSIDLKEEENSMPLCRK